MFAFRSFTTMWDEVDDGYAKLSPLWKDTLGDTRQCVVIDTGGRLLPVHGQTIN